MIYKSAHFLDFSKDNKASIQYLEDDYHNQNSADRNYGHDSIQNGKYQQHSKEYDPNSASSLNDILKTKLDSLVTKKSMRAKIQQPQFQIDTSKQ